MAALPYTPNPSNVRRFLQHIQSAGVPQKVTVMYLESVGFKSKNDRYIPNVLRAIGFIDEGGVPTDRWRQFRDKTQGPAVLAQSLRTAYASLFEAYPDAQSRDSSTLHNFMSANSDAAGVTVERMVGTFRALASIANFDAERPVGFTNAENAQAAAGAVPGLVTPALVETGRLPESGDMVQFVADGIVIRIKPTPENVKRAMRFLRIYEEDENPSAP